MFRLQDNTPDTYVNQSRDFQLFCRLYDYVNNATRFDIDMMTNVLDPMLVNDRLLELFCTKVGFFTNLDIDSTTLRYIISAFPKAIKNKGSKKGIEIAVGAILKAEGSKDKPEIIITNKDIDDNPIYEILIYTATKLYNKEALKEFLRYIVPAGYSYDIREYFSPDTQPTNLGGTDNLSILINPSISTSQVVGSDRIFSDDNDFDFNSEIEESYIGANTNVQVIGSGTEFITGNELEPDGNDTDRDVVDLSHDRTSSTYNSELEQVGDNVQLVNVADIDN